MVSLEAWQKLEARRIERIGLNVHSVHKGVKKNPSRNEVFGFTYSIKVQSL